MIEEKLKEIRDFLKKNADPAIVAKYSRYFKEGYDGYGIDQETFEEKRNSWMKAWQDLKLNDYLDLGDKLVASGKFEEIGCAIHFIAAHKEQYTVEIFNRVGKWLENGISNWGNTDVLCMLVLIHFLKKKIVTPEKFGEWTTSPSKWKRRAVPVTFVEAIKAGFKPDVIFPVIEPLMTDESEDVQKGLGTLLREAWKKYPDITEAFLLKWKDKCGRKIIQYATEKMSKEAKEKFKKAKK